MESDLQQLHLEGMVLLYDCVASFAGRSFFVFVTIPVV